MNSFFECRLLYSLDDMKRFLGMNTANNCFLYSVYIDSQKVFIVTFSTVESLREFESTVEKPKPTMLGCMNSNNITTEPETLDTLLKYVSYLESFRFMEYGEEIHGK